MGNIIRSRQRNVAASPILIVKSSNAESTEPATNHKTGTGSGNKPETETPKIAEGVQKSPGKIDVKPVTPDKLDKHEDKSKNNIETTTNDVNSGTPLESNGNDPDSNTSENQSSPSNTDVLPGPEHLHEGRMHHLLGHMAHTLSLDSHIFHHHHQHKSVKESHSLPPNNPLYHLEQRYGHELTAADFKRPSVMVAVLEETGVF